MQKKQRLNWLKCVLPIALFVLACATIKAEGNANRHNVVNLTTYTELSVSERDGIKEGVSAPFIGVSNDMLLVAGGCNFPDTAAAEGGKKVYYRDIYALPVGSSEASWTKVGELPVAAAYGVSVTTPEGIICIGGNHETASLNNVWRLQWDAQTSTVKIETLASLPATMDNMMGSAGNGLLYVAGGNVEGKPDNRAFMIRLDRLAANGATWDELPRFPGEPRIQPAGAVQNSAEEVCFYLMGGFAPSIEGSEPFMHTDGYFYSPREAAWLPIAEIIPSGSEEKRGFVGASAITSGSHHIIFMGGVNKGRFEEALHRGWQLSQLTEQEDSLRQALKSEQNAYMRQAPSWYQFNSDLLVYHTLTNTWVSEKGFPELAKAGAGIVSYKGDWYVVNGESKPGVRDTAVSVISMRASTSFGWINWTVLSIYLLLMVFLGWYFMKRAGNSDDFFRGGGRIPWWAAGISIYATMLSAITYMAIPAKAFATDWAYYPMQFSILLVSFPVIRYYLPFFRRLNVTSAYEYLERRFSYSTRFMASWLFIVFMVARSALVLYLPSLALTTVTGIDIYTCIILMGVITVAYCTMGGVEAVVWGDVVQGIILVGGAILAVVYLVFNTQGGFGGFVDIAISEDKFRMFTWTFDYTKATFWVVILGGCANNLISYTSDQTVIQRYLTTKDERGAGRGIMMNGIMCVIVSIVFYAIGTGLYTFFKSNPTEMNYALSNGDAVFPFFMMSQLPAGVAGLLIAAIFAATMSTIGSNVNSTATAFSVDIVKHFRPQISDKSLLGMARWSSIVFGVIGTLIALLMATWNILSILDYFNKILGLLSSGLGGLFIMGIFFDRIESKAAVIGFLTGTLSVLLLSFYTDVSFLLFGAIGIVVSVAVALLLSLVIRKKKNLAGLTWKKLDDKQ